jgi:hypothetical protein
MLISMSCAADGCPGRVSFAGDRSTIGDVDGRCPECGAVWILRNGAVRRGDASQPNP